MTNSDWVNTLPTEIKADIVIEHLIKEFCWRIGCLITLGEWLNMEYKHQECDDYAGKV